MTKEGIVTRIDGDTAVVLVKTMNACDVCRAECGGHCDKARLEKVCAKNDIGASVGNRVMLYSDTKSVMLWAVLVFILPIVLCFAASILTYSTTLSPLWTGAVGVLVFFGTFAVLKFVFRNKKDSDIFFIQEIIKGEKDNEDY